MHFMRFQASNVSLLPKHCCQEERHLGEITKNIQCALGLTVRKKPTFHSLEWAGNQNIFAAVVRGLHQVQVFLHIVAECE